MEDGRLVRGLASLNSGRRMPDEREDDIYVALENGYIGYIVDNQRLKRLQGQLQKVTSVTLLVINWLDKRAGTGARMKDELRSPMPDGQLNDECGGPIRRSKIMAWRFMMISRFFAQHDMGCGTTAVQVNK